MGHYVTVHQLVATDGSYMNVVSPVALPVGVGVWTHPGFGEIRTVLLRDRNGNLHFLQGGGGSIREYVERTGSVVLFYSEANDA